MLLLSGRPDVSGIPTRYPRLANPVEFLGISRWFDAEYGHVSGFLVGARHVQRVVVLTIRAQRAAYRRYAADIRLPQRLSRSYASLCSPETISASRLEPGTPGWCDGIVWSCPRSCLLCWPQNNHAESGPAGVALLCAEGILNAAPFAVRGGGSFGNVRGSSSGRASWLSVGLWPLAIGRRGASGFHTHRADGRGLLQDHRVRLLESAERLRHSRSRQQIKCASSSGFSPRLNFISHAGTRTSASARRPRASACPGWLSPSSRLPSLAIGCCQVRGSGSLAPAGLWERAGWPTTRGFGRRSLVFAEELPSGAEGSGSERRPDDLDVVACSDRG